MSDSDENEDENVKMLLDVVDSSLFNDDLYKSEKNESESQNSNTNSEDKKKTKDENSSGLPKSQRYIELDSDSPDTSKVPSTMKQFFAKKLSEIVSKQIEFVENVTNEVEEKKYEKRMRNRVKLLKDSDRPIRIDETISEEIDINRKKPKIKRRIIEPDNLSESEKCKLAAIEPDMIISGEETKHWSKRSKAEIFEYKSKNGLQCFRIEPQKFPKKKRKKKKKKKINKEQT